MLSLDKRFNEYIDKSVILVNKVIQYNLDKDVNYKLKEASNYAIFPEGHRYRSIIGLEIYEMLGGNKQDFLDSAVGIEFIHHASMTCDDLPCMDNSKIRKGKLAVHEKYGEDTAILSGLYSWNKGIHLIYNNALKHLNNPSEFQEVTSLVNNSIEELLEGQEMDLRKRKTNGELLESIKKKNILFHLAGVLPCYYLRRKEHLESLGKIGEELSIGYQLFDDLRDVEDDHNADKNNTIYVFGKEEVLQRLYKIKKTTIESLKIIKKDSELEGIINVMLPEKLASFK